MQLLFLNSRFGPACFWPGQASRRQTPFAFRRSVLRRRPLG
jgi:hypothetical protein